MSNEPQAYLDIGPRPWSAPDLLGARPPAVYGNAAGMEGAEDPAELALTGARIEAQRLIARAREEAAALRERAREEGRAEAAQALAQERERLAEQLAQSLEKLRVERDKFLREAEPEILKLSIAIAEKVIGREVSQHPDIVLDLIRKSMKRLKDKAALRIRVNPEDLQLVKDARAELLAAVDGVEKIELSDDRRVERGGCVIESANGTLDARVTTQLRELERTIAKVESDERDSGD